MPPLCRGADSLENVPRSKYDGVAESSVGARLWWNTFASVSVSAACLCHPVVQCAAIQRIHPEGASNPHKIRLIPVRGPGCRNRIRRATEVNEMRKQISRLNALLLVLLLLPAPDWATCGGGGGGGMGGMRSGAPGGPGGDLLVSVFGTRISALQPAQLAQPLALRFPVRDNGCR